MDSDNQTGAVVCHCGERTEEGTYEVSGRLLILKSVFGIKTVTLGLQKPEKLAKKLLKNVCMAAPEVGTFTKPKRRRKPANRTTAMSINPLNGASPPPSSPEK